MVRHSRPRTATRRVRQRFRCGSCGSTFQRTTGTVYARLRASQEDFDRAIALATEGMSQAGIARVLGRSPSTISRWISRAAEHAIKFTEERVKEVPAREVQIDELRTTTIQQASATGGLRDLSQGRHRPHRPDRPLQRPNAALLVCLANVRGVSRCGDFAEKAVGIPSAGHEPKPKEAAPTGTTGAEPRVVLGSRSLEPVGGTNQGPPARS